MSDDGENSVQMLDAPDVSHIGRFIRDHRTGRFTVEELAARAGISAGLISQLERGIGNPSFNTLMRLSRALGAPISSLFHGEPSGSAILRREERRQLTFSDGLRQELLVPGTATKLGLVYTYVPPGYSNANTPMTHPGEEVFIVFRGAIEVVLGNRTLVLHEGDSIAFDATVPHAIANSFDEPAEFLGGSTPPTTAGCY